MGRAAKVARDAKARREGPLTRDIGFRLRCGCWCHERASYQDGGR